MPVGGGTLHGVEACRLARVLEHLRPGPPSGSGTTANEAAGGLLLNAGLVLAGVGLTTSVGGGAYRHWQANRASETTAKGGSGSVTMELNALIDFCAAVFQSFGVKSAVAARLGRDIAQAEAWRQSTHGLDQLFSNVERLESGVFSAAAEPTVVTPSAGGTAVIDGHRCLGPVAMALARDVAVAKAREFGISIVHVHNTGWIGALGVPIAELVQQGFLVQAWCRSPTAANGEPPADAAPHGGSDIRLGTSPIAFGFPAAAEPASSANESLVPVLGDFSTTVSSRAAVEAMAESGAHSSVPRFREADGEPTTDPKAVTERDGSIMLLGGEEGGFRGFTLSLWSEALALLNGQPFVPPSRTL